VGLEQVGQAWWSDVHWDQGECDLCFELGKTSMKHFIIIRFH